MSNNMFESLSNLTSISVLMTDHDLGIQKMNETAKRLFNREQLDEIVALSAQGSSHYCFLRTPCEVEVIREDHGMIFLIQSKKETFDLSRKLENSYFTSHEVFQIMNSSFDGISIINRDGVILYQNPAFEQVTGLPVKDCIGKNVQQFLDEGIIEESLVQKIMKKKEQASVIHNFYTGKKVLISGVPIKDENGEITKIVNNIRDLTILNQMEKEIQELKIKNQKINLEIEERKDPLKSIVAHDLNMKKVIDRTLRVAQIDSTVLIQGESGSGKQGIVSLIHHSSNRSTKPFVQINCGAIPEHLLESELFGYEPGAFTGANQKGKPGLFEIADGGTIFLDEIGDMPIQLQVKLLRVLQEYEITRVGGIKSRKVDVRVVTATHRNLEEMVSRGEFREDLYYRLKIIPILVPPLRERKEDIIPLVYHFLNQIHIKYGIHRTFSQVVLDHFHDYAWPGNVRELQNVVERISLMVNQSIIEIVDIYNEIGQNFMSDQKEIPKPLPKRNKQPLKLQVEEFEKEIIHETLSQFPSIRRAAKALGVDQSTLVRKKQKYFL